jgi:hypothetical protein
LALEHRLSIDSRLIHGTTRCRRSFDMTTAAPLRKSQLYPRPPIFSAFVAVIDGGLAGS